MNSIKDIKDEKGKKSLVILKLGGSVLTDKTTPLTCREDVIERIAREVSSAWRVSPMNLIIGTGGGSYPHTFAAEGKLTHGIKEGWQLEFFAYTQHAAAVLNRVVVYAFLREGIPVFSIQPSAAGFSVGGEIKNMEVRHIQKLLEMGMVPVIYGDSLVDLKDGCHIASTERLITHLTLYFNVKRIILAADSAVKDKDGKRIPLITPRNFPDICESLEGGQGVDVTGGMKHKVESMLEIAKHGVDVQIINALEEGNIERALLGEIVGTRIESDHRKKEM